MPDFVDAQSVPVAPPSGGEAAPEPATPAHSPASHGASNAPASIPSDSRPVELSAPSVAAPAAEAPAVIPNGDFESSTEGWDGQNAALRLVAGVDGKAVRVSRVTTQDSFAFYAKRALRPARAHSRYRVGAFVRSVSPGMFVCLRAEQHTSGPTITTERCVAATSAWQRVRLLGRATGKGKITFSVRVMAALGGKSFDVDGFRLS
jgi:hypothetical protein